MKRWTRSFLGTACALTALCLSTAGMAQTFNGSALNTAGNNLIPSAGTGGCAVAPQTTVGTEFNATVAGLPPTQPLTRVLVNFSHSFDSDVDMFLRAPNGQILELTTDNGAGNDNFTDTTFQDGAPNITTGVAPFTGTFAPEGSLTAPACGGAPTGTVTTLAGFANGQNGIWQLLIFDDAGVDSGAMVNWSMGFGISADLAIVMTDGPDPVTAGTNLTYTVTMTNTGPDAAQNARFTVPLPAGTTLVSTNPSAGGACTAVSPIVCTWAGSTANAAVRTATIVALVAANTADGAFLNSSATATSDTPDADPADNLSTVSTAVVTAANLSMTLTDAPDPVTAGTNVTYTATLIQGGPSDAQNARFSVLIPAQTTWVSSTASAGGICTGTTTVTCTWAGATAPATNRSATIVVSVPANVVSGTSLAAEALATSDTVDPTPGNNAANASTAVIASADLAITLVDTPDPVIAGTNLSYTATLTNGGPSDAQGATITLPLAAGTSFVSATASAGGTCSGTSTVICTWAAATAPAGVRSATIVVAVSSGQVANLSATATASSSTPDSVPGNNTATATTVVQVLADLSITLADTPDPVIAGTQLTYTAVVSNAGPSDATAVVVTLPTPTNTSFVSGSVAGGGTCAGSPVVCTITGSILPGGSRTVTIVMLVAASAPESSTISATATVSAGSPDPNQLNNSASTTTGVITRADLALTLTAPVTQVLINVPVTFTAISLNQGPSDAQNVSVTITLTPDFRYTGHTATGATCTTPQVGNTGAIVCTWAGATAPGVSRTLQVTAFSNTEGRTAVNASTTSTTIDPVPGNNTAGLSILVGYLLEEIPTLNGLGLILMGLLFGLAGLVTVRRES